MKVYALAASAFRWEEDGSNFQTLFATYVEAHSEAEAEGFGYDYLRKQKPVENGWYGHLVGAIEISDKFMLRYLKSRGLIKR